VEMRFLRSSFAVSFNFSFSLLAAVTFLISVGGCGFSPGGRQPARQSIIKKGKNFLCRAEKKFLNWDTSQNSCKIMTGKIE